MVTLFIEDRLCRAALCAELADAGIPCREGRENDADLSSGDAVLTDGKGAGAPEKLSAFPGKKILLADGDDEVPGFFRMRPPLPIGALAAVLSGKSAPLALAPDGVFLYGEKILLTATERRLLSALIAADGAVVSREDLISAAFDGEVGAGALNVYIHYLRGKLEAGGRKVILSSSGRGYAVAREFLGGAVC